MTEISIIKIVTLLILGLSLWAGSKTFASIMLNIDKFGNDENGKHKYKVSTRALHNFWIGFAGALIVISGIFDLIGNELFIALFVADLTGLGLKLTTEFIDTRKDKG